MSLKIATLNLCLGLKNKKLQVKNLVTSSDIDILLLQETEIESNYDTNTLTFSGFNFEAENNSVKSRVGAYIKNEINYTRMYSLGHYVFSPIVICPTNFCPTDLSPT